MGVYEPHFLRVITIQVNSEIGLRVNFIFFVYQMRDGLRYKNKILQTWVVPIKNHALANLYSLIKASQHLATFVYSAVFCVA